MRATALRVLLIYSTHQELVERQPYRYLVYDGEARNRECNGAGLSEPHSEREALARDGLEEGATFVESVQFYCSSTWRHVDRQRKQCGYQNHVHIGISSTLPSTRPITVSSRQALIKEEQHLHFHASSHTKQLSDAFTSCTSSTKS